MNKNESKGSAGRESLPSVSVIITTFNRKHLVCKAIDNALAQRYDGKVEVIIVDDGSRDGTGEMIRDRYGDKVRYLYKENGGMNSATQHGIYNATGEIVALLDSDDWWYPEKLAKCAPLFLDARVAMVLHDLDRVIASTGRNIGRWWHGKDVFFDLTPRSALEHYVSGKAINAITTGMLIRREIALKVLPFPNGLRTFHDAYFARHVIFFGLVCAVREPLGAYGVHDSNDYGFKPVRAMSDARLAQAVSESALMSKSFNDRCAEFGIPQSAAAARLRIQNFSMAEVTSEQYRRKGTLKAVRWLGRNEMSLSLKERAHLMIRALLPPRLATFVNSRFFAVE